MTAAPLSPVPAALPDPSFTDAFAREPALIQCLARAVYTLEGLSTSFSKGRAKAVREQGGLLVVLDGLQKAKRLENQLRGRAGRQGDPGESLHFVSLEEPLMRTFAGAAIDQFTRLIPGFLTVRQGRAAKRPLGLPLSHWGTSPIRASEF